MGARRRRRSRRQEGRGLKQEVKMEIRLESTGHQEVFKFLYRLTTSSVIRPQQAHTHAHTHTQTHTGEGPSTGGGAKHRRGGAPLGWTLRNSTVRGATAQDVRPRPPRVT